MSNHVHLSHYWIWVKSVLLETHIWNSDGDDRDLILDICLKPNIFSLYSAATLRPSHPQRQTPLRLLTTVIRMKLSAASLTCQCQPCVHPPVIFPSPQNKEFVCRGYDYERLEDFQQRMLGEFPQAIAMQHPNQPDDTILQSDAQCILLVWLWLCFNHI